MKNINLLNTRLEREGARWRAKESAVSKLTKAQLKRRLGWDKQLEPAQPVRLQQTRSWSPGAAYDQSVDWRDRNGKNFVTPAKDQGGCGTCVSFAVAGLVESMALIEKGVLLDLSDADIAFSGSHAADCGAWGQGGALSDMKSRGAVLENRLPYASAFSGGKPSRISVPNHEDYAVKISDSGNIVSIEDRKSYLTRVGPLVCGITAYDDFFPDGIGVYSPSRTATVLAGHCILVVGYSDIESCWIVKNSWGADWGDDGFAKIAYGACDIDTLTDDVHTYFTSCEGVEIPGAVLAGFVSSKGLATLVSIPQAFCCDGFFTGDDGMRHAVVGSSSGEITEVFYSPKSGHGLSVVAKRAGLVDLGGFYTDEDKFRHVVGIGNGGNVFEVFYSPQSGIGVAELGNISGAIKVCGFYTPDDGFRHAVVANARGDIVEIFFGRNGQGQSRVATISGLVDIGGFYTPDDHYRHVIVVSADGGIREIYFHPEHGVHVAVLGTVPNATKVSAFYDPSNRWFSRRALVLSSEDRACALDEIRYSASYGSVSNRLLQVPDVADIGGFYSDDDKMAHCILSLRSNEVKELFYGP